jgi:dienelactone hydrolase
MELQPRLIDVAVPERPEGVVLILPGGASRRANMMVSPTQLSVLRMVPIARRIARATRGRVAVFRLLNSRRGWDTHHTPVVDARYGLDRITERFGAPVPACLVGHSLGGRAALLSAGRPEVRSVAALAPSVYPTDVPTGLLDQRILIVHGSEDRIASPERSAALARNLGRQVPVSYVSVRGGKHAMHRRHAVFAAVAAEFAAVTLLGASAQGAIARAQAGEAWVTV